MIKLEKNSQLKKNWINWVNSLNSQSTSWDEDNSIRRKSNVERPVFLIMIPR